MSDEDSDPNQDSVTTRRNLTLLADMEAARQAKIMAYDPVRDLSSDADNNSETPHFDRFYNERGSQAIIKMKHFDPIQFNELWDMFSEFVHTKYNVGTEKNSPTSTKDTFFYDVNCSQARGSVGFLAKIFGLKGPTFEAINNKYVQMIAEKMYELSVQKLGNRYPMCKLIEKNRLFTSYKYARYATDVTFQQSFRPRGSLQEGKRYFSANHKLYGFQVEVSVLPKGYAIGCIKHYQGSTSDLTIFQSNALWHKESLLKSE